MEFSIDKSIEILERTPHVLIELTNNLSEDWTMNNEGGETWSVFDVVGHLIHGERTDWMSRARTVLHFGEGRTFERFDRLAMIRESQGKSLGELLDEFARVRSENLEEVRALNLQQEDLAR